MGHARCGAVAGKSSYAVPDDWIEDIDQMRVVLTSLRETRNDRRDLTKRLEAAAVTEAALREEVR